MYFENWLAENMPESQMRRKALLDRVAAGQRSPVLPPPNLDTRLAAFRAYDELHAAEPKRFPPRKGWRKYVWRAVNWWR